jgi:hypothetical protein
LLSVLVFIFSVALTPTDGTESVEMIVMRTAALTIGLLGQYLFCRGNISSTRWHHTLTSTKGVLFISWTLLHACVDLAVAILARPTPSNVVSSVLGTLYSTTGFLMCLMFDSVKQISRTMHITLMFWVVISVMLAVVLSSFVWTDDTVLGDVNGGQNGELTHFAVKRTRLINLLVLMVSALITIVKKNRSDNAYFSTVDGNVMRWEILELVSLRIDPDGVMHNALKRTISRHSIATSCVDMKRNILHVQV